MPASLRTWEDTVPGEGDPTSPDFQWVAALSTRGSLKGRLWQICTG